MGDGLTHHEGGNQVLDRPRLSAVRAEFKSIQTPEKVVAYFELTEDLLDNLSSLSWLRMVMLT